MCTEDDLDEIVTAVSNVKSITIFKICNNDWSLIDDKKIQWFKICTKRFGGL